MGCRVLDTPAARKAIKKGFDPFGALVNSRMIAEQLHLPYLKLFFGVMLSGYKNAKQLGYMATAFDAIMRATEKGDLKKGVLTVGQATGLIHDIPTVAQLLDRMVKEAKDVSKKVSGMAG
jgi:enoyl-[acyl-carrier protein] reductase II